jgi:hypothetical protein
MSTLSYSLLLPTRIEKWPKPLAKLIPLAHIYYFPFWILIGSFYSNTCFFSVLSIAVCMFVLLQSRPVNRSFWKCYLLSLNLLKSYYILIDMITKYIFFFDNLEDTKMVIRRCKSKKDRQYNSLVPKFIVGVCVDRSLAFWVVLCRLLFVL